MPKSELTGIGGSRLTGLPAPLAGLLRGWASAPASHPLLGDWRQVGYLRGGSEPSPADRVVTNADLGVHAGDSEDVSKPLQTALDDLAVKGGGTLRLGPGRYVLDNPLFIHGSNVVLTGAGKELTTLFFTRPLRDSIHDTFAWSWTGGQVFFVPRERLATLGSISDKDWSPESWGVEGWVSGPVLTAVSPAPRGAQVLLVEDASAISPGEMVLLEVGDPPDHRLLREIAGDVPGAAAYDWATRAAQLYRTWAWPVVVSEVLSPRLVRIEQPLRISLHREASARLVALGPTVHDSGIEALTIENALLPQTVHLEHPGSNGVCFQAAHDCWATDVHVLNADVAFGMTAAKSCTLTGVSAGGRSLHHFTVCRAQSHDNLVQDFELEEFTVPAVPGSYLHGISVEQLSSGNVWRRGTMRTGTFDSHRGMPFENLRTDIVITNKDAVPGGAFTGGPYFGARTVHWGITVTNDQRLCIDVTDQAPRSLTAGIAGLTETGSRLNGAGIDFPGDLESQRLEFGTELGPARDLLDLQRALAPVR